MAGYEARRSRVAVIVGAATLGVALVIGYLLATVHTGLPFAQTTKVKAAFEDVDSLSPGDQVRQNSVRIGSVEGVEFVDGRAVVTLKLEGDRPVYRDARAAVTDYTAVGTKFVDLDRGTPGAGRLPEDTVISASETVDSADLYEVLNVLDEPTRDAASRSLREVGGGAAGHSEDVQDLLKSAPDLLADLGTVSSALASEEADLPTLLRAADGLSSRLADRDQQITSLIEQSEATLSAFVVDDAQPLEETLEQLPGTLSTARTALDALDKPLADAEAAMVALRPGAESLSASEPDLRGVLREGVGPLERVPGVAELAEPAVEDLTATFADARPLVPPVTQALTDARSLVEVMAPYAPEIGQFAVRGNSFLAAGPALPGLHYARLGAGPATGAATASVLEGDGLQRNIYPEPGEASFDRAESFNLPGLSGGDR